MAEPKAEKSRGLLYPDAGVRNFQITRYFPEIALRDFVQHYWISSWDLPLDRSFISENLPYPSVNLIFEAGNSRVVGVIRGKFTYLLKGKGKVLGIQFWPGGFYPFVQSPVSKFTDSSLRLEDVFGEDSRALERSILGDEDEPTSVEVADQFLLRHLPAPDNTIEFVRQVVSRIAEDKSITKVKDLVDRFGMSDRTLQYQFNKYVGVGPKWVINRYRLHEVTEQIAAGNVVDWSALAYDLGYTDQAHFIKDFKALVGRSPADYSRNIDLDS